MKTVLKLLGAVVVLILTVLLFIFSGLYDVSASAPDSGLVAWSLRTTQSRSPSFGGSHSDEEIWARGISPAAAESGVEEYQAQIRQAVPAL